MAFLCVWRKDRVRLQYDIYRIKSRIGNALRLEGIWVLIFDVANVQV